MIVPVAGGGAPCRVASEGAGEEHAGFAIKNTVPAPGRGRDVRVRGEAVGIEARPDAFAVGSGKLAAGVWHALKRVNTLVDELEEKHGQRKTILRLAELLGGLVLLQCFGRDVAVGVGVRGVL
ncbi:hypothetical protein CAI21_22480, partial [Alkalilimnicola ehrlichii]